MKGRGPHAAFRPAWSAITAPHARHGPGIGLRGASRAPYPAPSSLVCLLVRQEAGRAVPPQRRRSFQPFWENRSTTDAKKTHNPEPAASRLAQEAVSPTAHPPHPRGSRIQFHPVYWCRQAPGAQGGWCSRVHTAFRLVGGRRGGLGPVGSSGFAYLAVTAPRRRASSLVRSRGRLRPRMRGAGAPLPCLVLRCCRQNGRSFSSSAVAAAGISASSPASPRLLPRNWIFVAVRTSLAAGLPSRSV